MRIKMLETYSSTTHTAMDVIEGIRMSTLEKGVEYEADLTLATWLIENGKAEKVVSQINPPRARRTPKKAESSQEQ